MTAHLLSFALALLTCSGVEAGPIRASLPSLRFPGSPGSGRTATANQAVASAGELSLLTGIVDPVSATGACARSAATYVLISRHGRVRIGTNRPTVERLLRRVSGRSITVTVAGHHVFDPRCRHLEVEAAWLRRPRPQPLRPARRGA